MRPPLLKRLRYRLALWLIGTVPIDAESFAPEAAQLYAAVWPKHAYYAAANHRVMAEFLARAYWQGLLRGTFDRLNWS